MNTLAGGKKFKIARPLSVPGSPKIRSSSTVYMTPGDLGTLQDANNADDYFNLSMNGGIAEDDDDDTSAYYEDN